MRKSGKRDEPSFLIKVMPLLGHAGLPQKKQFSTRIVRLGSDACLRGLPSGRSSGAQPLLGLLQAGYVAEKKLTAFAFGGKVGEGRSYRWLCQQSLQG
jgi:hypothetical protein